MVGRYKRGNHIAYHVPCISRLVNFSDRLLIVALCQRRPGGHQCLIPQHRYVHEPHAVCYSGCLEEAGLSDRSAQPTLGEADAGFDSGPNVEGN